MRSILLVALRVVRVRDVLQRRPPTAEERHEQDRPHRPILPHYRSFAVIEIWVAERARLIGQPFFAASASSLNLSAVAFGTFACTSRWISRIVQPTSFLSMFTVATVLIS